MRMFEGFGNFAADLGAAWGIDRTPPRYGQQQQQQQPQQPPPTSRKQLRNLPTVRVTADDLIEESNKNCCICLEDQTIGTTAVKLGCGHIYHPRCLTEWLQKSCMCPICRYELETDDASYEAQRKSRMRTRKLRYRKDELHSKSISKLKELMVDLDVSSAGAIEKQELIERLVSSNKIDIVEGVPQMEISESDLSSKSVPEIKAMLRSFGLPTEGALYKSELIDRLVESGRVLLVRDARSGHDSGEQDSLPSPTVSRAKFAEADLYGGDESGGSGVSSSKSTSSLAGVKDLQEVELATDERIKLSRSLLAALSVGELKLMMKDSNVSYDGCLERSDLIDRFTSSPKFLVLDE